jgi:hypothetical protein
MLRIIALSMVMLFSFGALLPLTGSSAHGLRQGFISSRQFHHRRHSRAWWRRHRARMARIRLRRRQEAAMMAHRKSLLQPVMPVVLTKRGSATVSIPAPELVMATIPGTVPAFAAVTGAERPLPLHLLQLSSLSGSRIKQTKAPLPRFFKRQFRRRLQ